MIFGNNFLICRGVISSICPPVSDSVSHLHLPLRISFSCGKLQVMDIHKAAMRMQMELIRFDQERHIWKQSWTWTLIQYIAFRPTPTKVSRLQR